MNFSLPLFLAPRRWVQEHEPLLLRLAIIGAVLVLSAFLARRAQESYLVMIVGGGAALILLQYPLLGLFALLVGSLVVPFTVGTGTQTPLNITVVLIPVLLGIWVVDMIRQRNVRLVPSRVTLPAFAFTAAATVSLLAGSLPWNPFAQTAPLQTQVAGWAVFIFSLGVFLLVGNQIKDQRWLKILVAAFLVIAALYMAGRVGPGLNVLSTMMNGMGSDGSLFWVWVAAIATGQLVFNRQLGLVWRLALALLIAATLGIGFFLARSWTSGWLPPMVAVATILALRSWRLGILIALVGIVYLVFGTDLVFQEQANVEAYSIATRDAARDILLFQVFPLSPIFGLGPSNYYWYTPLYPILGWYVSFNSHNNYVDILLQLGVVGMACFLWLVGEIAWLGWRLRTHFENDFAAGYVNACLGGLAGTLVACWLVDWLFPFAYNIGLTGFRASILAWIFMGGLISLEQIARRAARSGAKE